MVPLVILVVVALVVRMVGMVVGALDSWPLAVAVGLAAMFVVTGLAHWGKRRAGLVAIVPLWVPRPQLAVTVTGWLELTGAVGLLVPATRAAAAFCLAALLFAIFPANVRAAGLPRRPGVPHTALAFRSAIQAVFVAAALFVGAAGV